MEHFSIIWQLAGQFRSLSIFLQKYASLLAAAGLVFSLLNCFFGYRLRKLWSVAAGFLAGIAAGTALCIHFQISSAPLTLLAALGGGIVCAALAFLLYRAGLFFLCAGLTFFVLYRLLSPASAAALAACLLIGAVVGLTALFKKRLTVSLATAIGGGFGASEFLLDLTGNTSSLLRILLILVFAFLGILVQLKPWKSRSYWEERDRSDRKDQKDAKKERRRQKRKQKRKKKARREKKQAKKESRKNTSSGTARKQPAQTQKAGPSKPPSPTSSAPAPSPEQAPAAAALTEPASEMQNRQEKGVDLSDIRLQLSREVSEIYREEHPQSSPAANTPEDPHS